MGFRMQGKVFGLQAQNLEESRRAANLAECDRNASLQASASTSPSPGKPCFDRVDKIWKP